LKMKKTALVFLLFVVLASSRTHISFAGLEPAVLIEDEPYGDKLEVGTTSDDVWAQLIQLHQNGSEMWIGGAVEPYPNQWGFRFDPDNILMAEYTAETYQSSIRMISEDLDYWLGLGLAYVWAGVVQVLGSPDVNWDGIVNVTDLTIVSLAYGSFEGEPDYISIADINEDGIVDMKDLSTVARHLGETDQ